MRKLIFLAALLAIVLGQTCIGQSGVSVEWWVALKVPPKIGKTGFGYYDSTMRTGKFVYHDVKIDVGSTALTRTIDEINKQSLETVAWNDEKPTGETSSSSAHSKGFMAISIPASKGVFVSHSIPKYPAFANGKINPTIAAAENVYGQDLVCMSLTLRELDYIASHLIITWPFVYEARVTNTTTTQSLFKLAKSNFPTSANKFEFYNLQSAVGYSVKAIFKNDKINCSIFEDGLTSYLSVSPLIAETWGRPLEHSWCSGGKQVLNVVNINLSGVTWNEQDDHSKWVLAKGAYACFGDMNRMSSQWKRGGAFYCFSESTLVAALDSAIVSHDNC